MAKTKDKKRKEKEITAPGGEMKSLAFIYWSELDKRYEMKIDNKLKAFTEGRSEKEHDNGKNNLEAMAEEKGYKVIFAG